VLTNSWRFPLAIITVDATDTRLERDEDVRGFLARYGVEFDRWEIPSSVKPLVAKAELSPDEKQAVLDGYREKLAQLATDRGYIQADLIVLHPETPGLDAALAKFDKEHYHTDDEVRYIVDGRGVFGFVGPDGERFRVEVHAGEFISVPKGAWHWFYLCEDRRIKAVRLFQDMSGWTPYYRPSADVPA
jgi:1,2-dihydroxy-3-keto-5-methylthiopentene dioxygenase